MEHLSDDWIAAFDRAVAGHEGLRAATADQRLVIRYVVVDPAGTERDYALVLDHGDNRVVAGPRPDADVTFRTDAATAAAIAAHAESAQTAFMAGRLRLGGDVRVLLAHQDLLADVDDCAAAIRPPAPADGPGATPPTGGPGA